MDELYTITFQDQPEKGEKIPKRNNPAVEKINNVKNHDEQINKADNVSADKSKVEFHTITLQDQSEKKITISPDKNLKIPVQDNFDFNWEEAIAVKQNKAENQEPVKIKTQEQFHVKYGKPPLLTTKAILARQGNPRLPVRNQATKKSFFEMAHEYAGNTHEKTEHIPFMCYWPSYEYMSEAQLNWYFYLRGCLRNREYIDTDLSYLFVYIYELINQIGVSSPEDGFEKMIKIWENYRKTHDKLDRYMIDWTSDYIRFYSFETEKTFELLEKEGLFLLMPADMLMEHYIKNNIIMPLELIARFSDYKFYESEFINGADGNLFTDHLPGLFHKIRQNMNQEKEGGFESRYAPPEIRKQSKIPFLRAPFENKANVRLQSYFFYEQHKPLRVFITSIVKEFENQLRALKKHKGRLRPDKLSDEIINICKTYAKNAIAQPEQRIEIKIDRERLLALIQDSDEVRKKLIEGNYEYGEAPVPSEQLDIAGEESPAVQEPIEIRAESQDTGNKLLPDLSPVQQKIIDFLLEHDGSSNSSEINAAFQGVFVGVEIDRINDAALEMISDLLIGFEDDRWYVMEDYIDDL